MQPEPDFEVICNICLALATQICMAFSCHSKPSFPPSTIARLLEFDVIEPPAHARSMASAAAYTVVQ